MQKNILITSISSKVPLIKRVIEAKDKFDKDIKIFGADIDKDVLGRHFVDEFLLTPKISVLGIDEFIIFCFSNNIGYIVPSRDEDVIFFAKHKKTLAEENIFVFVSDYDSVEFCYDKLKFYEDGDKEWTIQSSEDINNIDAPKYVVKERYGAGGKNIFLDVDKEEARELAKKLDKPIFQPYIKGIEYSVDSYVDKNIICIASIIRSRDLVINGESKITTVVQDEELQKKVKLFLEEHKIRGHCVLQIIKQADSYSLIECNARFGGASTLSYELGLESFYWFLQESNNKTFEASLSNKILKQIRIQKDIYLEC